MCCFKEVISSHFSNLTTNVSTQDSHQGGGCSPPKVRSCGQLMAAREGRVRRLVVCPCSVDGPTPMNSLAAVTGFSGLQTKDMVRARLRQREQSVGEAGVGSIKFSKNTLQMYLKGSPSSTLLLIPWFAFSLNVGMYRATVSYYKMLKAY